MHTGAEGTSEGTSATTGTSATSTGPVSCPIVGMSTVGEVIAANHMGIECLGISCVTNMAAGVLPQKLNHEEVLAVGLQVRDTFVRLLKATLPEL